MHEWGLVAAEVHRLAATTRAPVPAVELRIASTVVPDVALAAFTAAAEGTVLAGTDLRIVPVQATLTCLDCTRSYPGAQADACPHCGGTGLVVARPPEVELGVAGPGTPAVAT